MSNTLPDDKVVRIVVDLACRAPSVHNIQPWQWRYAQGRLDLFTEHERTLASADPTGRQSIMSCGAALNHLETALTAFKWSSDISRVPEIRRSEPLATVRFHRDARPRSHDFDLLTAIRRRYSDRRPFGPLDARSPMPPGLHGLVHRAGAQLTVLSQDARPTLARATELTAAARKYDSAYQAELHWWAGHSLPHGGIPPDALATEDDRDRVDIGRRFPIGRDGNAQTVVDHSTVLVLSTETDDRRAWLGAGEALSAVLLEATVGGLATCPLTHITELRGGRDLIRELIPDRGIPQALVRVGTGAQKSPPRQTPRRPLDSVLSIEHPHSPRRWPPT